MNQNLYDIFYKKFDKNIYIKNNVSIIIIFSLMRRPITDQEDNFNEANAGDYPSANTTTLSSFTDGLIPSVKAIKSVGEQNTDGFTDGSDPSVKQSSVNPISVANSVAN